MRFPKHLWQKELAKLIAESVFPKVWIFSLPLATLIGYLEAGSDESLRAIFDWHFHFDPTAPFEALVPGGADEPDAIKRFIPVAARAKPREPKC